MPPQNEIREILETIQIKKYGLLVRRLMQAITIQIEKYGLFVRRLMQAIKRTSLKLNPFSCLRESSVVFYYD
jgi:hypothetical protein